MSYAKSKIGFGSQKAAVKGLILLGVNPLHTGCDWFTAAAAAATCVQRFIGKLPKAHDYTSRLMTESLKLKVHVCTVFLKHTHVQYAYVSSPYAYKPSCNSILHRSREKIRITEKIF